MIFNFGEKNSATLREDVAVTSRPVLEPGCLRLAEQQLHAKKGEKAKKQKGKQLKLSGKTIAIVYFVILSCHK